MKNLSHIDLSNPQMYYIFDTVSWYVLDIGHADLFSTILQYFNVVQNSILLKSFQCKWYFLSTPYSGLIATPLID